jgi:hypothetical protein
VTALAEILDDLVTQLTRYVVFANDHQPDALALWLAYTHAISIGAAVAPPFDVVAYVLVTSPERLSGKSTLKDVMRFIAARGEAMDGITAAALLRMLKHRPTFFIDEIDTVFKSERGEGGDNETLRAVLNSGFAADGRFIRVQLEKDTAKDYPTFSAKAMFGIGGGVPETITSRSIRIRLQRKERGQGSSQRARLKVLATEGAVLRDRLASAMEGVHLSPVAESDFDPRLGDRAVDIWESLYAVADCAGGDWPSRVRCAAVALATGESEEDDESLGEMLLRDIREVFDERAGAMILLADLVGQPARIDERFGRDGTGLCGLEDRPWADFRGGKPITARKVASVLKGYGIKPERMRVGGKQGNAFYRTQFDGAWRRYLHDDAAPPGESPAGDGEGAEDDDALPF